ncbi:MAG: hypothetical protein ACRDRL_18905, partial [Sciscionella sp.]
YWVLRRAYKVGAGRCAELVEGLLNARELRVDQDAVVRAALNANRGDLDFADAIIDGLGRVAGCDHTVTPEADRFAVCACQLLVPLAVVVHWFRLIEPAAAPGGQFESQ